MATATETITSMAIKTERGSNGVDLLGEDLTDMVSGDTAINVGERCVMDKLHNRRKKTGRMQGHFSKVIAIWRSFIDILFTEPSRKF